MYYVRKPIARTIYHIGGTGQCMQSLFRTKSTNGKGVHKYLQYNEIVTVLVWKVDEVSLDMAIGSFGAV